jgi:hypothetical protein
MPQFPPGFFGPHPKYAVLPVCILLGVIGWAVSSPAGGQSQGQTVVALKPVEGEEQAGPAPLLGAGGLPIEVIYGVPSGRTLHLWEPRR